MSNAQSVGPVINIRNINGSLYKSKYYAGKTDINKRNNIILFCRLPAGPMKMRLFIGGVIKSNSVLSVKSNATGSLPYIYLV